MTFSEYQAQDSRERRRWWIALWVMAFISWSVMVLAIAWMFPAMAHSWYGTTKDPETGLGCCGGQDCKQIPSESVKLEKGGWRYLPTGELIPFYRVQQSHDFEFHRCEYLYDFVSNGRPLKKGDTRCFYVPGGTG